MVDVDKEMVPYGISIRQAFPDITAAQLRAILEARFIGCKDVLSFCQTGIICNPLGDFLAIAMIVVNSARKIFIQKPEEFRKVQAQIDAAVAYLMMMK